MAEDEHKEVAKGKDGGRNTAALVLAGVLGLFAVLNLDEVEVNWGVAETQTPLFVVIAVSVLLGAGIGWLASRRRD